MKEKPIRVLYPSGALYRLATVHEAHRMIRSGVAEGLGSKQRFHAVQLLEGPSRPTAGTTYSHKHYVSDIIRHVDAQGHETTLTRHPLDANPQGCWTMKRISHLDRGLFMAVQTSCLSERGLSA